MEGEKTMGISEAAEKLDVSRGTIYRMIEDGRLKVREYPYLKHGRVRVLAESVEQYLPPTRGDAPPREP